MQVEHDLRVKLKYARPEHSVSTEKPGKVLMDLLYCHCLSLVSAAHIPMF